MTTRIGSCFMALAFTALAVGALAIPKDAAAQQNRTPVLTEQPPGDGTPVPRTPDGRADLSGFWNKGTHPNTSAPIEPLPFTEAGLKAFNDVADLIDPTSYCHFPGIPRMNSSPYPMEIDDPKFYTEPWTTGWVMPLGPPDWELMEYACTDNNRDAEEGLLQPGALDGSGRDGTAIATPSTYR